MNQKSQPLLFEMSRPGRRGVEFPECDVPTQSIESLIPPEHLRQEAPDLPELSELDVVRHFTRLSHKNYSVDGNFYPLGSCTMKYNPKVNEIASALTGIARLHPYQPEDQVPGILRLLYDLEQILCEICGMHAFSLQPSAGAHGEALGLMLIHAYHEHNHGEARKRVLVPDAAHGTNPASAARCGYAVQTIDSNDRGEVDINSLRAAMDADVAALMLTNPNTLGLFETQVQEMTQIVHDAGGLVYYDGANANAILGICRPGDMGFDVVHLNLHKTFSTPHGGGGPGAGPVGVCKRLEPFLPVPRIVPANNGLRFSDEFPLSVGKIRAFYGNVGILVRAYAYIRAHGADGLRQLSENAVLNANYMMARLKDVYHVAHERTCMHEFVLSAEPQKAEHGVTALDIAKALLDYGYYAPTIYFPLIVREALMIEPTETESKETLDGFIDALIQIAEEAKTHPESIHTRPHHTPVRRLDEVKAARKPNLRWRRSQETES